MGDTDKLAEEFSSKGTQFIDDVGRHFENGFVWVWAAAMNVPAILDRGVEDVSLGSFTIAVSVTSFAMSNALAVVNMAERDTDFKSKFQQSLLAGVMSAGLASGTGVVAADVGYDLYEAGEEAYEMFIES